MTSAELSQTCCKTTGGRGQTKLLLECKMFALKLAYSGMEVALALACAVACEPKERRLDP